MMFKDLGELYRGSWRFALACPLLFAVPVVAELVQHAAELHIGMYDGFKQAEAIESHPLRMAAGFIKSLSLILPGYWFLRYLGHGGDGRAARTWEPRAVRLWVPVLLWATFWLFVGLWGGAPFRAMGMGKTATFQLGFAAFLALTVLEIYLSCWKAGAPLGNGALSFRRSIGLVRGHFWWSLGLFVLAFLPLMVVHYALGLGAIGRPVPIAVAMLAADAVVVGFLALVLIGTSYFIARRATSAAGVVLLPESAEERRGGGAVLQRA